MIRALTAKLSPLACPLFMAGVLAYAANRLFLLQVGADAPLFMRNHFNDLFTIPVMIPLLLASERLVGMETQATPWKVLGWCAAWSIMFEGIFPKIASWSTGDPIDVLCYFAGAAVYLIGTKAR